MRGTHFLQSGRGFLVSQFELKTTIIIRIENLPVDETAWNLLSSAVGCCGAITWWS